MMSTMFVSANKEDVNGGAMQTIYTCYTISGITDNKGLSAHCKHAHIPFAQTHSPTHTQVGVVSDFSCSWS